LVAGSALVLLLGVLAWPALRGERAQNADDRVPLNQMGDIGDTSGSAPGPLTGTPREQADRLFNRVMSEREAGDTAQARFFVPMAVQAYEMAGGLDADGYYHVSLLHHTVGDYRAAIASAEKILATSPDNLLGLSAAAAAARAAGDDATARRYYQEFLRAYDVESKKTLPEYQDHGKMLPQLKLEAESFVKAR
jgi:tetratricopeptide (TPR) repeat protein